MSETQSEHGHLRPTSQDGDGIPFEGHSEAAARRANYESAVLAHPRGPGLIADSPTVPFCSC